MAQVITFGDVSFPEQEIETFKQAVPKLVEDIGTAGVAGLESEPYVEVAAKWWGLVFVLSDQAARDLATGTGGIAGVVGAITAVLAAVPGVNIAGAIITGILTLHATAIGLMNRGQGVYITALWPLVLQPLNWIPTPR